MTRPAIEAQEFLTNPAEDNPVENDAEWVLLARNSRVNRKWELLIDRSPENALRWYRYLRKSPTTRYPGRVFPLKRRARVADAIDVVE
jgi:hypothetical protein